MKQIELKAENYILIPSWVPQKLKLKGNDMLVYSIIYGFTQDGESWFLGSDDYLATWCNCTKRGININLNKLLENKLIIKQLIEHNGTLVSQYRANLDMIPISKK